MVASHHIHRDSTTHTHNLPHRKKARYGWKRDIPDSRDHIYSVPIVATKLPAMIDLRDKCPPIVDQGDLGSCTANAIAGAVQFDLMKQQVKDPFAPSRLFIYYNERVIEGSVDYDSGAEIRDGIRAISRIGVPPEADWPYDISKFTQKPSDKAFADARLTQAVAYGRVIQLIRQMQAILASGYPFVFGFTVYDSFESAQMDQTGIMPMPATTEEVLGGHAVMAVGYDDGKRMVTVRNSWGTGWGDKGYFYMPYEYITNPNLASDFWMIRTMS